MSRSHESRSPRGRLRGKAKRELVASGAIDARRGDEEEGNCPRAGGGKPPVGVRSVPHQLSPRAVVAAAADAGSADGDVADGDVVVVMLSSDIHDVVGAVCLMDLGELPLPFRTLSSSDTLLFLSANRTDGRATSVAPTAEALLRIFSLTFLAALRMRCTALDGAYSAISKLLNFSTSSSSIP